MEASSQTATSASPVELKFREHPSLLIPTRRSAYQTRYGASYIGDSLDLLSDMPDSCVNLVVTSPPYALHFKKEYGNVDKSEYVEWLKPFGLEIHRVLTDDGSFVLNIGGSYNPGSPTRSLYHFKALLMLCEEVGFTLAQECFWFNPAKLPSPAEWVNVRRVRIRDSVEYVWWLAKTDKPKANNSNVLTDYSDDMKRILRKGYKAKKRPSGHVISGKFKRDRGGAIPPNIIVRGNNESNSEYLRECERLGLRPHPARFPRVLPEFFVRLLTDVGDLILDPFAGSNMTGSVAEEWGRTWLAFELDPDYVTASRVRFDSLSVNGAKP